MTDQMRKEFEKWQKDEGLAHPFALEKTLDGEYLHLQTRDQWVGFQAAWNRCAPKPVEVTAAMANRAFGMLLEYKVIGSNTSYGTDMAAVRAALTAALQGITIEAERDAARYRWLRENHNADLLAEDIIDEAIQADAGGEGK